MSHDNLKTPGNSPSVNTETIVAEATPTGRAGVSIVRLSGGRALPIAEQVVGRLPAPRQAYYRHFQDIDQNIFDQGVVLWFQGPASFTGEDVVEFQGHGGPVVVDLLKQTCVQQGARLARPGEFSERAFLNDKLDLVQLEAIADLIDSASQQAARGAYQSLSGVFSREVDQLVQGVTELRIYVEAAIDFPEEEIDFLDEPIVAEQVNKLVINLTALLAQAEQGRRLQSGLKVALIGPPNAGKSSILNRLTGDDSAIVTNIPGTTRDVVKEQILIDGLPLVISDTAGIRKASDAIEAVGIERSWQVAEAADVSLIVFDATDHEILANKDNDRSFDQAIKALQKQLFGERPAPAKTVVVLNKMDALSATEQQQINQRAGPKGAAVLVSAKTGESWQTLLDAIKAKALDVDVGESVFSARARHIVALKQAQRYLAAAKDLIEAKHPGELVAEELKMAQETLGEITGKVTSDELLGKIFGSFCIGK